MKLYNSLSRTIEEFIPVRPPAVTFYSCGVTVYDYTHIGQLRSFTNADVLHRFLTFIGYDVHHIINITDVGHLTDDADEGEDKLEKGARKYGKTVWEVAEFYTKQYQRSLETVNILKPEISPKATDHIVEMIQLIEKLLEKGHAYITDEAVYFDVTTFEDYGKLSRQSLDDKKVKARSEVVEDPKKRHPADFALWFKRVGRFKDHAMHWESPWGDGFPGWHIECSAMSMKYLGETVDIHSGGVDLLPVHHENEIAQSESITGKPFVKIWMHNEFLTVDGLKMSKSLNNFYTVDDIVEKGFDPLALRYLYLQTHYRQTMNFTWDSLSAAQNALTKLKNTVIELQEQTGRQALSEEKLEKTDDYMKRFTEALANDLQTSQALAILWEVVKSNIPSGDKLDLLYEFDTVLGLGLKESEKIVIPADIIELANKRQEARANKDFSLSDTLRMEIEAKGYEILDKEDTYEVRKLDTKY